jgi:hypothetical protein
MHENTEIQSVNKMLIQQLDCLKAVGVSYAILRKGTSAILHSGEFHLHSWTIPSRSEGSDLTVTYLPIPSPLKCRTCPKRHDGEGVHIEIDSRGWQGEHGGDTRERDAGSSFFD